MVVSKIILEFLILFGSTIAAAVTIAFAYATYQYSLNIQSMQLKFDKKVQKNIDANSDKIDDLIKSFNSLTRELKDNKQIVIEDAGDDRTEWNL
jgi:hypothetical protein